MIFIFAVWIIGSLPLESITFQYEFKYNFLREDRQAYFNLQSDCKQLLQKIQVNISLFD